jgi:hypothetical protein
LSALFLLVSLASAHAQESRRGPLSETSVEVSTRQVRIAFPTDTSGTWGWPVRHEGAYEGYVWSALVEGMDGPVSIGLWVYHRDTTALTFSSLEPLIAAGYSTICLPGMVQKCRGDRVTRTVENNRITLILDDPAVVARLFGTRPKHVRVTRQTPADPPTYESDSVPIRYVPPQIPQPDSALLAEAERGRRQYQASITSIDRHISGGEGWSDMDDIWVAAGDSIRLSVAETHCHYDSCWTGRQVSDSGWSVRDSSIVRIRPNCGPGCVFAYGHRIGKTMISVRGLHGPSDTMPSGKPPARRIQRRITVGRPVARVAILPRPDTVRVGQPYTFRARAFDRAGRVIPEVPIEIVVDIGHRLGTLATKPYPAEFRVTGRRPVIATFRGLADTLMVTVMDDRLPR